MGLAKRSAWWRFCPITWLLSDRSGRLRAGGQDLVAAIEKENFTDFDVAVATPDMMRSSGRLEKCSVPRYDAIAQGRHRGRPMSASASRSMQRANRIPQTIQWKYSQRRGQGQLEKEKLIEKHNAHDQPDSPA